MLGQLPGQEEPDRGLDLPGGDGGPLVVVGQLGGLSADPREQIVDEGVHDAHGLGGDTSVGVHLLQDLVDVDGVGLLPFAFPLLLGDLTSLGGSFCGGLGRHDDGLGCTGSFCCASFIDDATGPARATPLNQSEKSARKRNIELSVSWRRVYGREDGKIFNPCHNLLIFKTFVYLEWS